MITIPTPNNGTNTLTASEKGMASLVMTGADMNSTTTVTDAIDLLGLADVAGPMETAAIQVVQETGATFATCVTTIQGCMDGRTWLAVSGATLTGAGVDLSTDISTGYRFLRLAVTTAEGGAATATLVLTLRRRPT